MSDLNSVQLIGRLGHDPELKALQGGKSVCSFRIAVNDGWGDRESVIWIQIETWGKTAENVAEHCAKGKQIAVTGKLKMNEWVGKQDGKKHSEIRVTAFSVQFLGAKGEQQPAQQPPAAPPAASVPEINPYAPSPAQAQPAAPTLPFDPNVDDDVPF